MKSNREHAERICDLLPNDVFELDISIIEQYLNEHFPEAHTLQFDEGYEERLDKIHSDLLQVRQMVSEIRDNQKKGK